MQHVNRGTIYEDDSIIRLTRVSLRSQVYYQFGGMRKCHTLISIIIVAAQFGFRCSTARLPAAHVV